MDKIEHLKIFLGLIIPFLAFTSLAEPAYYASLVLLGYSIYQLDMPSRIAEREGLHGLLIHRRFIRFSDSFFYTIFYWLNNRLAESVQNTIAKGVGTNDPQGFFYFGISVANVTVQALLIVIFSAIQRNRIGRSLHHKAAKAQGPGLLYFTGVLALGGNLLLSLVIMPTLALMTILRNAKRPARAFEQIKKFKDDLLYNWSRTPNSLSRYMMEFLVIDALLLSVNLRFFIGDLVTRFDYQLIFVQMLFLTLSCVIPAVGAYYSIVKQWTSKRLILPILVAYGSSILLLIVEGPRASPFLLFISKIPMFSKPDAIFSGTFFVAALMVGFLAWTPFSIRAHEAYEMDNMQSLEKNLSLQVTAIMVTIVIGALPLMIVSSRITGEPPFAMLFVIIIGYLAIAKVVYAPYSRKLERLDSHAEIKGLEERVQLLTNEHPLYEVNEYPPISVICPLIGETLSFTDAYVLGKLKVKIIITNQRLLRVREIKKAAENHPTIFLVFQDIRLSTIRDVQLERLLLIPTALTLTIGPHNEFVTFYPLDPAAFRRKLVEALEDNRFQLR